MPRVLGIADSLQDHVVTLLERNIADVLHRLHERDNSAESLLSRVLVVACHRVLMVHIVARPDILAEHPCDDELREATIPEWLVGEQARSLLLRVVTVAEHRRVCVVIRDTAGLGLLSLSRAKSGQYSAFVRVQ